MNRYEYNIDLGISLGKSQTNLPRYYQSFIVVVRLKTLSGPFSGKLSEGNF